jgi:hypothetical protein
MQYRDQAFNYDSESEYLDAHSMHQPANGKQYRRRRSLYVMRRRTSKSSASKPSCGIGARRNRRFTW